MTDLIKIIKKQIADQTREHLNVDVNSAIIQTVSNTADSPNIGGSGSIIPVWTHGQYDLIRPIAITPEMFINYSGQITWKLLEARAITIDGLNTSSNNLFGIQLFSTQTSVLNLNLITQKGILSVYKQNEGDSSWTEIFVSSEDISTTVSIPIDSNNWQTIIITFYALTSGAKIYFTSDYLHILSWRHLDISSPSIPTWASPAINRVIIREADVPQVKLTLRWNKDTSIGFGGNGIYKHYFNNSGLIVDRNIPSTLLKTESIYVTENNNEWFALLSSSTNTINSGDIIKFGSASTTSTISYLLNIKENKVKNNSFQDGSLFWTTDLGGSFTQKNDNGAKKSKNYQKCSHLYHPITNSQRSGITSSIFAIATNNIYNAGMYSRHDIMFNGEYGLDGFGNAPSGWSTIGSITSIIATRDVNFPYMRAIRDKSGGQIRIKDSAINLWSINASYQISCPASFPMYSNFQISGHRDSGATLFTSPTLYGSPGYILNTFKITPSQTQAGYIKITIPSTTSTLSFATLFFGPISISQKHTNTNFKEVVRLKFFDSNKTALATEYYDYPIEQKTSYSSDIFKIGTNSTIGTTQSYNGYTFPSGCAYCKIGYVATINSGSTIWTNRDIYGFVFTQEENYVNRSIFATETDWTRIASGASFALNDTIQLEQFEHIFDRDKRPTDGAIATWSDYAIEINNTYEYYLDAYDTSAFKNRSSFSVIASIFSGDTTAPKAPSNYTLEGAAGGIYHSWTNPTANDLKYIRCYDNSGLTSIKWEVVTNATGKTNSYSEIVTSTVVASRYLTAIDSWGNESTSTFATVAPLEDLPNLPKFNVIRKDTSDNVIEPNEFGWFNQTVVASLVFDPNNNSIASMWYSYMTPVFSNSWSSWTAFNGTISFTQSVAYYYYHRFKIKDIYNNYSAIQEIYTQIETDAPVINNNMWEHSVSEGYDGYNLLSWNSGKFNWQQSGANKIIISKAKVTSIIRNPSFEDYIISSKGTLRPDGWDLLGSSSTATIKCYSSSKTNGQYSMLWRAENSNDTRWVVNTPDFNLANGETLYGVCKYRALPTSGVGGATIDKITLYVDYNENIGIASISNVTDVGYWKELNWEWTRSGTATVTRLVIQFDNHYVGDQILIDEVVLARGPIFSTIAELAGDTTKYIDRNIEPWERYLYRMKIVSQADNISLFSEHKYIRAVTTYRDKFRNMLGNSSFEKTHYTTGGTLIPDDWNSWYWDGQFSKNTNYVYPVLESGEDAYHGQNYIITKDNVTDRLYKEDIHILPYRGYKRNFIYSAYVKNNSSTDNTAYLVLSSANNVRSVIYTKTKSSVLLSGTGWTRISATFSVSVPSISYLRLVILSSGSIWWDALQLEEKDSLPPTDYYDADVVIADHIQGALIRANWLEAEQIYGGHIKANTITATNIKSDTITSNEIKANTITATEIAANTINATLIKSNTITATQIMSNTITTNELNLVNTIIYTKENEITRIRVNDNSGAFGTCWGMHHFVAATVKRFISSNVNINVGYYHISNVYDNEYDKMRLHTGFWDHRLDKDDYTFGLFGTTIYSGYRGYNQISVPRTIQKGGPAVVLMGPHNSQALYSMFATIGTKNTNKGFLSYVPNWSNPVSLDSSSNILYTRIHHYGSNFWASSAKDSADRDLFFMLKLTEQGAWSATFTFPIITGTINRLSACFDFDSNGTMLCAYAVEGESKIRFEVRKQDWTQIGTFSIQTYTGFDKKHSGILVNNYAINECDMVFSTLNKFVIGYSLWRHNKIYYRIIDINGNELVGKDKDLSIMDTTNLPTDGYEAVPEGGPILPFRLVRNFNGDILFYISPDSTARITDPTNWRQRSCGKGIMLQTNMATINIKDLFNRFS